jgi:hypothetical protein
LQRQVLGEKAGQVTRKDPEVHFDHRENPLSRDGFFFSGMFLFLLGNASLPRQHLFALGVFFLAGKLTIRLAGQFQFGHPH